MQDLDPAVAPGDILNDQRIDRQLLLPTEIGFDDPLVARDRPRRPFESLRPKSITMTRPEMPNNSGRMCSMKMMAMPLSRSRDWRCISASSSAFSPEAGSSSISSGGRLTTAEASMSRLVA